MCNSFSFSYILKVMNKLISYALLSSYMQKTVPLMRFDWIMKYADTLRHKPGQITDYLVVVIIIRHAMCGQTRGVLWTSMQQTIMTSCSQIKLSSSFTYNPQINRQRNWARFDTVSSVPITYYYSVRFTLSLLHSDRGYF